MAGDDPIHTIISRKDAIARGLKHYFTGKKCSRGHLTLRRVSSSACCECCRLDLNAWRASHRDRASAHWRVSRKRRQAQLRAYELKRYWSNPEFHRQRVRSYYAENSEEVRRKRRDMHRRLMASAEYRSAAVTRAAKWAENNPERARFGKRAAASNRRARIRKAGKIERGVVAVLMKEQKGKCAYCRARLGKSYHLDHIVALSRGGTNAKRNLQLLCGPCNLHKATRDPMEHARSLGFLL